MKAARVPRNVRLFAWLWLGSNLAAIPELFLLPPPPPEAVEFGITQSVEMAFGGVGLIIAAAFTLPFFWLVVWRRRSWARWVLLVSFITDIPLWFVDPSGFEPDHLLLTALLFVSTLVEAASFYFVFSGDARPWFQGQNPK
jgi:hypothetical protein